MSNFDKKIKHTKVSFYFKLGFILLLVILLSFVDYQIYISIEDTFAIEDNVIKWAFIAFISVLILGLISAFLSLTVKEYKMYFKRKDFSIVGKHILSFEDIFENERLDFGYYNGPFLNRHRYAEFFVEKKEGDNLPAFLENGDKLQLILPLEELDKVFIKGSPKEFNLSYGTIKHYAKNKIRTDYHFEQPLGPDSVRETSNPNSFKLTVRKSTGKYKKAFDRKEDIDFIFENSKNLEPSEPVEVEIDFNTPRKQESYEDGMMFLSVAFPDLQDIILENIRRHKQERSRNALLTLVYDKILESDEENDHKYAHLFKDAFKEMLEKFNPRNNDLQVLPLANSRGLMQVHYDYKNKIDYMVIKLLKQEGDNLPKDMDINEVAEMSIHLRNNKNRMLRTHDINEYIYDNALLNEHKQSYMRLGNIHLTHGGNKVMKRYGLTLTKSKRSNTYLQEFSNYTLKKNALKYEHTPVLKEDKKSLKPWTIINKIRTSYEDSEMACVEFIKNSKLKLEEDILSK